MGGGYEITKQHLGSSVKKVRITELRLLNSLSVLVLYISKDCRFQDCSHLRDLDFTDELLAKVENVGKKLSSATVSLKQNESGTKSQQFLYRLEAQMLILELV